MPVLSGGNVAHILNPNVPRDHKSGLRPLRKDETDHDALSMDAELSDKKGERP